MNIVFYTFSKQNNSTARPSSGTSYSCNLIEPCSVLSPQVVLNVDDPSAYNYAYIGTFGRYYYVNNWTYRQGLWVGELAVDALASWKTTIGASTQYVVRAEDEYDETIIDTQYPTSVDTQVYNTTGTRLWSATDFTGGVYVISVTGGTLAVAQAGSQILYAMTPAEFANFCNALYGYFNNSWNNVLDEIQQAFVRAILNPLQYISSCRWYPFTMAELSTAAVSAVPVSYFVIPGVSAHLITSLKVSNTFSSHITIPKHPQTSTRGKYVNAPPYSRHSLIVNPWGRLALNPASCVDGSSVSLETIVDLATGIGALQVGITTSPADTHKTWVSEWIMAGVGIDLPLSQVNNNPIGAIGDLVSTVGSSLTAGTPEAAISGTVNGISSFASSLIPSQSSRGNIAGCSIGLSDAPKLESEFYTIVDESESSFGRPLCKEKQISTIPGFIKCEGAHISVACTSAELQTIITAMNGGFFYE